MEEVFSKAYWCMLFCMCVCVCVCVCARSHAHISERDEHMVFTHLMFIPALF